MNFFGPSDRILLMDSAEIKELSESCAFLLLLKRPQRGGVIQMFRIPRPSINVKDLLIHTKCTQQKTTKIAPLCGIYPFLVRECFFVIGRFPSFLL